MNYIKRTALAQLYRGPEHPIDESYAELKLIRAAFAQHQNIQKQ